MSTARARATMTVVVAGALLLAGCGSSAAGSSAATTSAAADGEPTTAVANGVDASTCADDAFDGRYLYEIHGDAQSAEGFVPVIEVGMMTFDGAGSGTRVGTLSTSRIEAKTTFTYETADDCVGTITTEDDVVYRATFSPAGDEVTFFASGGGGAQRSLDGAADRVDDDASATCDEATLAGTYQYRARGTFAEAPHVEHGFEVYDGEGDVTNAFRVAGEDQHEELTGTYEVDEDCHAVVTYGNGVTLDQYVAPDGSEFFWVQTDGFDEPGLFGGHEHRVSASTDTAVTTG